MRYPTDFSLDTIHEIAPEGATITKIDEYPYLLGVHFTMPSGRVFSIQWGSGNYCSNRAYKTPNRACSNAEFATWVGNGEMDEPDGWVTVDWVVGFMNATIRADREHKITTMKGRQ